MKTRTFRIKDVFKSLGLFMLAGSMVACSGETTDTAAEVDAATEASATTEEAMDDPAIVKEISAVDLDNDGLYTTFTTTTYYEDFDVNGDKTLDENEFGNSMYKTWDTNRDNNLDETEWNTASKDFGMDQSEVWAKWDTNNDGKLSEAEHRAGVKRVNWFQTWDTDHDQKLSEKEYVDGVFVLWDRNKDGKLDSLEYVDVYNRNFKQ